jgi:branched-chain amino acid transport system ATP-binding protein
MLTREIFSIIKKISETEGLTILVVEQDAKLALGLAQHGYLLETGSVVMHDAAASLQQNDAVRRSYLGF